MICQNQILELNSKRQCWLPINPSSQFQLCSRCEFYKVEEILKDKDELVKFVEKPFFQELCKDNGHKASTLHALLWLQQEKHSEFEAFFHAVSTEAFTRVLHHDMHIHSPCSRCSFYQYIFKTRELQYPISYSEVPWNCWQCLSFILRQKSMLGYYRAFSNGLIRNKLRYPERNLNEALESMISLDLNHKSHAARLVFEQIRRGFHDDEKSKEFLVRFLTQPATVSSVFNKRASEYIPELYRKDLTESFLQKEVLKAVRKRNWVFKEDLMIKTWHPDRLFLWCFDIEEMKDFESANMQDQSD